MHRRIIPPALAILTVATGIRAGAQTGLGRKTHTGSAITVSGDSVDRLRVAQLVDSASSARFLLRSSSLMMLDPRTNDLSSFRAISPIVWMVSNSAIPSGQNDGALWAGKAVNARAVAGFDIAYRQFRLIVLPEFAYSSNDNFRYDQLFVPRLPPTRNPFSSPWNVFPYSIDAPPRFGTDKILRIAPGQSTLSAHVASVEIGLTSENEWWGPGIRNAIILSDNAEGFPRAFVRPFAPLKAKIGTFDFRLTWGGLKESPFFDFDPKNDLRYWSGMAATWSPAAEPNLTVGLARAVYAVADNWGAVALSPLKVFLPDEHPDALPVSDTVFRPGRDQLISLFGRWVFPGRGFEAYGEFARAELPRSLRDLLISPNHSQGYTFGFQWASQKTSVGSVRLQAEHTYLEQDPSFRERPLGSFYTSRAVLQGYTNRGQVLGAGIGQGSSGEWIATDLVSKSRSLGIFGSRTRFNNDAFYLLPFPRFRGNCQHDVTLGQGIRGNIRTPVGRISASYSNALRESAFFQNTSECQSFLGVIDRWNQRVEVSISLGG